MAIKILSHRLVDEKYTYFIFYESVEELDTGYMFPCNEHGELSLDSMSKGELDSYWKCESEEYPVVYQGMRRVKEIIVQHTIGECYCGSEVILSDNSNQCECGEWYNQIGQEIRET